MAHELTEREVRIWVAGLAKEERENFFMFLRILGKPSLETAFIIARHEQLSHEQEQSDKQQSQATE